MLWLFLSGALLLLIVGLFLVPRAGETEKAIGLGRVQVVYSDTDEWVKVPEPLYSARYGLTGRPDYIVQTREGLAVVELKPLRHSDEPYESDLMQLAAYCLLLEEDWDEQPAYGLLRYANQTFRLEWTDELREELLEVLAEMRELQSQPAVLGGTMPTPQHDMTVRCRSCGFNYVCWPDGE